MVWALLYQSPIKKMPCMSASRPISPRPFPQLRFPQMTLDHAKLKTDWLGWRWALSYHLDAPPAPLHLNAAELCFTSLFTSECLLSAFIHIPHYNAILGGWAELKWIYLIPKSHCGNQLMVSSQGEELKKQIGRLWRRKYIEKQYSFKRRLLNVFTTHVAF